jgi:hypothetical protein
MNVGCVHELQRLRREVVKTSLGKGTTSMGISKLLYPDPENCHVERRRVPARFLQRGRPESKHLVFSYFRYTSAGAELIFEFPGSFLTGSI